MTPVGMSSLAIAFPPTVRTNDWWREHHPEVVRSAADRPLDRLWARDGVQSAFERAMARYAADPFKGARERRVLRDDETALGLELDAAGKALAAAGHAPDAIDLAVVCSLRPDTFAVGDAAFLAREMRLRCPAVNLETACSSSLFAFDLACTLVSAGRYRRILVVSSCTYSRDVDPTDTLSWFLADGAAAFVVEARSDGAAFLGAKAIHTAETCGAFVVDPVAEDGRARMKMRANKGAGTVLHDTAEPYLSSCCRGALDVAGLGTGDVDFFVLNTPTAWYAEFGADVLGIPPDRTISTYDRYTNLGPVLLPVNLWHAAHEGRIAPGDTLLFYSVGSASTAIAAVVRWGEVALGPPPG